MIITYNDNLKEQALYEFEIAKYSDTDPVQRPASEALETEFDNELLERLEEEFENFDDSTWVTLGYRNYDHDVNVFVKLTFTKDGENVNVIKVGSFTEDI